MSNEGRPYSTGPIRAAVVASSTPVFARLALLAVALVAVIVLAGRLAEHRTCDAAKRTVFAVTIGSEPRANEPPALRDVLGHCRGSDALAAVAGALHRQRRHHEAAEFASIATRREPRSAAAWSALAITAAADGDRREAARARRRVRRLSPLVQAPASPTAPAPRRRTRTTPARPEDVPGVGTRGP